MMRDKIYKIIVIVLIIVAVGLLSCIGYLAYQKTAVTRLIKKAKIAETYEVQNQKYECPIDFDVLNEANPEIYAWITIPDTNIDFPVVQSDNNTYYFNRDIYGNYSANGSIYTEIYNGKDFEDRVTVIYGHNMKSGAMFRSLKEYSDREFFDSHDKMYIYLPDRQIKYELVGAVPFDSRHLLKCYDMADDLDFEAFCFDALNIKEFDALYSDKLGIKPKDKLVILSTCYFRDRNKRYLIIWKELEE